ncbi:alpha/beta fold hydrolase [Spirillospora sp. NPDC052269]
MRSRLSAAIVAGLTLTLAGGTAAAAAASSPAAPSSKPGLAGQHPCDGQPGFTCATLQVPLDHRDPSKGTLDLQVGMSDNTDAPKGTLLFLTGGPGQPGVPFLTRIMQQRLPDLAKNYRFVMIDQRGTGAFGAIDCPKMQAEVGSSDIAPASRDAVAECASVVGDKRSYYTTEQTVGDLDMFRSALGVNKWVVDGVSYGSFTAANYAAFHPGHVDKVVLDSVLPHTDPNREQMLYTTGQHAVARVLRAACQTAPACGYDPAQDVAYLARHRKDAVLLWDMLVSYEFVDPSYRDPNPSGLPAGSGDVIGAMHAARLGDATRLDALMKLMAPGGDPLASFSAGLHEATICGDGNFPWGTSETPVAQRPAALDYARRHLPASATWPFTSATAAGNGFIQECLTWPVARHTDEPKQKLPPVPILIVNGDHDLSTPMEWAKEELANAPQGKLVIVKGASHSIQNRERGTQGRDAVYSFLNG